MKIIKKLSQEEVEEYLPKGLQDALYAKQGDVFYCMICDGLRLVDHECRDIIKPNGAK